MQWRSLLCFILGLGMMIAHPYRRGVMLRMQWAAFTNRPIGAGKQCQASILSLCMTELAIRRAVQPSTFKAEAQALQTLAKRTENSVNCQVFPQLARCRSYHIRGILKHLCFGRHPPLKPSRRYCMLVIFAPLDIGARARALGRELGRRLIFEARIVPA